MSTPTARHLRPILAFVLLITALGTTRSAGAQVTDDDGLTPSAPVPAAEAELGADAVRYGIALRTRLMWVPRSEIELFVKEAPSGMLKPGFGVDFVRRKGNFELVAGLGYDGIGTDDGFYLEKGDTPPAQTPDYVRFDGLGWITAEVLFMWHVPLHEMVSLRYGAGFGLGYVVGDALQTDTTCTSQFTSSCTRITGGGGQIDDPADIFPVFPVVNLRAGAQVRPTKDVAINFDLGLRTAFFFGLGAEYFF